MGKMIIKSNFEKNLYIWKIKKSQYKLKSSIHWFFIRNPHYYTIITQQYINRGKLPQITSFLWITRFLGVKSKNCRWRNLFPNKVSYLHTMFQERIYNNITIKNGNCPLNRRYAYEKTEVKTYYTDFILVKYYLYIVIYII